MADIDIEELNEAIRNLNNTVKDLSSSLGNVTDAATMAARTVKSNSDATSKANQGLDGLSKSTKGLTEVEIARLESQKKLAAAEQQLAIASDNAKTSLKGFAGAILDNTAKLSNYADAVGKAGDAVFEFGKAFGPLGMLIGGVVKGFTMLMEANLKITQSYLDGKDALNKMGGAGSHTTKSLQQMALEADLNAETLNRMIKPMQSMGQSIMTLGTTAGDGQKEFAKLIKATEEERKAMSRLGISQEQMMQGTADYLALQSMSGRNLRAEGIDREKLRKSSQEYQVNLMDLAALTGKDVNELKEKQKEMMFNRQVQLKNIADELKLKQLREQAAKETDAGRKAELEKRAKALQSEIDNRAAAFQALGGAPEALKKGIQQLTTGTIAGEDAQKLARLGLLKDVEEYNKTIREGGDQQKAAAKLQDAYQRAQEKAIVTVGRSAAINDEVAKNYALNNEKNLETVSNRIGESYEEDLKIQRERRKNAQTEGKDAAADAAATAQEVTIKANKALESLISKFNPLTGGMIALTAAVAAATLALSFIAKKGIVGGGGEAIGGGIKGVAGKIFGGGGGGAAAAAGGGAPAAGGAGAVVEQLGGKGGGMLEGAAKGLASFANPQVVLGAAGLGAAITAIGAGIAGATWIMGKALPSLAGGLKAFEELDGQKLVTTGKGILALGGGLAVFGAGGAAAGIGGIIGGLGEKFGKALGIDGPFKKLQEFSKLDIDAPKVKANAEAFMAFNKAMAAGGAGGAVAGVGNLISGLSDKLSGKMNLKGPLEKMKEFESVSIDAKKIKGNAEAFGVFSEAMSKFKPAATGGVGEALVKGINDFFSIKPPVEQMKDFASIDLGEDGAKRVKSNAQAFIYFSKAMESFKGSAGTSIGAGISKAVNDFFEVEPPVDQMLKFSQINLGEDGVKKVKTNAETFGVFADAMSKYKGTATDGITAGINKAVSSFFEIDPPTEQMLAFSQIDIGEGGAKKVKENAQAFVYFSKAMESYKGSSQPLSGIIAETASQYFELDPPTEQMVNFAKLDIGGKEGVARVKTNADAFVMFSNAMSAYKGGGELKNAVDSMIGGVVKFFGGDDVIGKFVKFTKLDVNPEKAEKLALAFARYAKGLQLASGGGGGGGGSSGGGGGGAASSGGGGGGGGAASSGGGAAPAAAPAGGGGGGSSGGGGLLSKAASFFGFGGPSAETDPDSGSDAGGEDKAKPVSSKPKNVTIGPAADVSGVDPNLLTKFYTAASEFGKPITINSAYRGDQKQAELWVRGRILGDPGVMTPAKPKNDTKINYKGKEYNVAGSGKGSKHREGDALDISTDRNAFDSILAKHGLHRPYKQKDPPHVEVQAAKGGIASGPTTGYPATLHGNEMIIPLDPNSLLAELGKKSQNQVESDMKQKASSGGESSSKDLLVVNQELMNMLSSKLDNMIDKLATSNQTQSKLLKYSQA